MTTLTITPNQTPIHVEILLFPFQVLCWVLKSFNMLNSNVLFSWIWKRYERVKLSVLSWLVIWKDWVHLIETVPLCQRYALAFKSKSFPCVPANDVFCSVKQGCDSTRRKSLLQRGFLWRRGLTGQGPRPILHQHVALFAVMNYHLKFP